MKDFVILDLETTGLNSESCKIIEFGAIKVCNGLPIATMDMLINPMCTVPLKITQITGITSAMVIDKPTIYDIFDSIEEFCGQQCLVGYNIDEFDMKFLNTVALEINGTEFKNKTFDMLPEMRKRHPGVPHNLEYMATSMGYNYNAHRALSDCQAVYYLMQAHGLLK